MLTFKQFIREYLTPSENDSIQHWNRPDHVSAYTNHFFGTNNDEHNEPLVNTEDKSEVHRAIERHIGQNVNSDDYKKGMVRKDGKMVRITQAINDPKLQTAFKTDNTRKNVRANTLSVRTTRSRDGIAGQTSHGQSWEDYSCKNFIDGLNKKYLRPEYENGTVVSYLHDHKGREIARATFHPHINDEGNVVYKRDSYYGLKHPEFEKHNIEMEKRLSMPHTGSPIYKIHPEVYNDSGEFATMHPNATTDDISKALDDKKNPQVREAAIRNPNATPDHISKALDDKDMFVRMAAIKHANVTPNHINKALDDEDGEIREAAISHPNATPDHISKALDDKKHRWVRIAAIRNPNATPTHFTKALEDDDPGVRFITLTGHHNEDASKLIYPNIDHSHINKALEDEDEGVRSAALDHPIVDEDFINNILRSDKPDHVKEAAVKHHKAGTSAIQLGLSHPNPDIRSAAASNNNISSDQLHKALDDENLRVNFHALMNRNITDEHIDKASKKPDLSDFVDMIKHRRSRRGY